MKKILTFDEFIQLAKENYAKGGDTYYECWDERTFNDYVEEFGAMTKAEALEMFKTQYEIWNDYQATIW